MEKQNIFDPMIDHVLCESCNEQIPLPLFEQHMLDHDHGKIKEKKPENNDYSKLVRIKFDGKGEEQDCKICFNLFKPKEILICLKCMHKFHEACFMQWTKEKSICPVCRSSAL